MGGLYFLYNVYKGIQVDFTKYYIILITVHLQYLKLISLIPGISQSMFTVPMRVTYIRRMTLAMLNPTLSRKLSHCLFDFRNTKVYLYVWIFSDGCQASGILVPRRVAGENRGGKSFVDKEYLRLLIKKLKSRTVRFCLNLCEPGDATCRTVHLSGGLGIGTRLGIKSSIHFPILLYLLTGIKKLLEIQFEEKDLSKIVLGKQ